ncbi:MAG: HNH endonuclease [Methanobrevibacter sp.]|nr:HNH endonuclease [Methanobrevibacter sp.]
MDEPIPLELHHLNGIHTDNRLENLQILCPNCHALTNNYSGKVMSAQLETIEVEGS